MRNLALRSWPVTVACFLLLAGCGDGSTNGVVGTPADGGVDSTTDLGSVDSDSSEDSSDGKAKDVAVPDVSEDSSKPDATKPSDAGGDVSQDVSKDAVLDSPADAVPVCTTRITYGSSWMHAAGQDNTDLVSEHVTWDGACHTDGVNSYAVLSNGWKPYFQGNSSCVIALDYSGCAGQPSSCETRVSYGTSWLAGPSHPNKYDDASGELLWNGACYADGSSSYARLSNGWTPYFSGGNSCQLSFRYTQCKGLYSNPVVDVDCPDPGVILANGQYVMVCTGYLFPMRVSSDLVHWAAKGTIFSSSTKPVWAQSDFWAPEIHKVGSQYVAYFTARNTDGKLSVGAASSVNPTGPFKDIGKPLLHDPNMGLIDASHIETKGKHYVIWKEDGNAVGKKTPIHIQELGVDGLSLVGTASTLITNDQAWEGSLVEGPWMVERGGMFYLFYSANGYASPQYAIGVARSNSPTAGFTKHSGPIVSTTNPWVGPGHNSIVRTPGGADFMVYHSWKQGQVGGGAGRVVLIDRVEWDNGWPQVLSGPSHVSLPMPQ